MDHEPESVADVLGELDELAATHERVCIGDVLDDFGKRSFGPFMMIPALIELTPIGGIPGVPTFLALIIALTAAQLLMGRDHVWLPAILQNRAITGRKLHKAVGKLRGVARWLDDHSKRRLEMLTHGAWSKIAAAVVIALCCAVPPLELLPFASSLPMIAIAMLGMALTVRDGALTLAAIVFAAIVSGIGIYLFMNATGSGGGLSIY
jgi:hypothetical protein